MKALFSLPFLLLVGSVVDADARNRLPGDPSFETSAGEMLTREVSGAAQWEIDSGNAAIGSRSLKFTFGPGERTQGEAVPVQAGKQTFSFYAKADRATKVQFRFVKTDWTHTLHSPYFEVGPQWNRYEVSETFKAGLYRFHLGREGEGEVWIDALQLESGGSATPYISPSPVLLGVEVDGAPNRVFFEGEPVELTVALATTEKAGEPLSMKLDVRDGDGNPVLEEEWKEVLPDDEGAVRRSLSFKPGRLGYYEAKVIFGKEEEMASFAVVKAPVPLAPGSAPFNGINSPISEGTRRIGARWTQMSVQWNVIEPEEGNYNWSGYDHLFASLKPEDRVILMIGRNPRWSWDARELKHSQELGIASPGAWGLLIDEERMDAWRRFISKLVQRYGERVAIWEIGGEDDLHWGRHPYYNRLEFLGLASMSEVYRRQAATITAAAEEIRKLIPEARIGAIRPSGVDAVEVNPRYQYSSAVLERAGRAINVFPIDPYGSSRYLGPGQTGIKEPEAYLPDSYADAREMLRKHSPGTPFYVSEFGYSVAASEKPAGPAMQTVARYLSRTFLMNRATPGLFLSFWYTSVGGGNSVFSYNLWHGRNPTLAVSAYSAVAAVVENTLESRRVELDGRAWAVVFRKEDHARAAIWQTRGESVYRFAKNEGVSFTDWMGNPIEPRVLTEGNELLVTGAPIYLRADGKEGFEKLSGLLRTAYSTSAPLDIALSTPDRERGVLHLRNLSSKELELTLATNQPGRGYPTSQSIRLDRGESKKVEIPLTPERETLVVTCEFEASYDPLTARFPIAFHAARRVGEEWKLDGDLAKWKETPVAVLASEEYLRPVDWNPWKGADDLGVEVYLGWNERYFFLSAKVHDDLHAGPPMAGEIGQGDTLEVGIDPVVQPDTGAGGLASTTYDFNVALDAKGKAIFRQWAGPEADLLQEGDYVVLRKGNETIYEIGIPWERLKITPEAGRVLGVNLAAFDDDAGKKSRIWMQWGLGLTQGKDDALFPKVYLAP